MRIRMVAARSGTFYGQAMIAGDVYTVAGNGTLGYSGDGGPATKAALKFPGGVAVDQAGNLVIADTYNSRIRVVAATSGTFYGKAMATGHIYTVAGDGTAGFTGDGGPATSAELDFPDRVTVDPTGNLVISDGFNNRVRVVAAKTGTFYGKAMTKGDIYTIAGNGTAGFGGDGGPGTSAELNGQEGVQVDAAGNVLIADLFNERIPRGRRQHRHVLRRGHDHRAHLHRGQRRHRRVHRRRRACHQRRAALAVRRHGGRCGEPDPGRRRQQPDPGGRGQERHVLRRADDRGQHLHGAPAPGSSGSPGTAARPATPTSTSLPPWWRPATTC